MGSGEIAIPPTARVGSLILDATSVSFPSVTTAEVEEIAYASSASLLLPLRDSAVRNMPCCPWRWPVAAALTQRVGIGGRSFIGTRRSPCVLPVAREQLLCCYAGLLHAPVSSCGATESLFSFMSSSLCSFGPAAVKIIRKAKPDCSHCYLRVEVDQCGVLAVVLAHWAWQSATPPFGGPGWAWYSPTF